MKAYESQIQMVLHTNTRCVLVAYIAIDIMLSIEFIHTSFFSANSRAFLSILFALYINNLFKYRSSEMKFCLIQIICVKMPTFFLQLYLK